MGSSSLHSTVWGIVLGIVNTAFCFSPNPKTFSSCLIEMVVNKQMALFNFFFCILKELDMSLKVTWLLQDYWVILLYFGF